MVHVCTPGPLESHRCGHVSVVTMTGRHADPWRRNPTAGDRRALFAREVTAGTAASRPLPMPHTWSKTRLVPGASPAIKACVSVDISAVWRRQRRGMGLDQGSPHPRCSQPLSAMARILRRSLNPETCALRSSLAASAFSLAVPRASSVLRPRLSPELSVWHWFCQIGMPVI